MRKKLKRIGLAVMVCAGVLSAAGCAANTAGGDLEANAFLEYSLEGGNLINTSNISASGNNAAGKDQHTADEQQQDEPESDTSHEDQNAAGRGDDPASSHENIQDDPVNTDQKNESSESEQPSAPPVQEPDKEEGTSSSADQPAETEDPLKGLTAVARVEKWVNVRVEPSTQSGIVGKIYNNCAATIIDEVNGENGTWYYMSSGNVTGYVKSEYFVIGEEAEALKSEIGLTFARVIVENLRVRETPDLTTSENIVTMYPMGTEVAVLSHDDEWALIETDAISTGYVHVSCIEMWTEFDTAITLEEEAQIEADRIAAEEAARAAEEAYLALLAQQQAGAGNTVPTEPIPVETPAPTEPVPAETPAPTEPVPAETPAPTEPVPAETPAPTEPIPAETPAPTEPTVSEADVNTALRNAIVAFALQFNGCPYVHGGRSLSHGTDCSGFTNMVYQNFGYNLDWTPAGQANLGMRIDYHNVKPGDLLFYSNSQKYLGHVALYIGNGQIIHAANEQYGICIWDMNYREPLFAVSIIN